MGVSIKTASGIAIGGIIGFYLVNKALNFARQSIAEITEASKWRSYYRHGHEGKMVPPGYSEMPVPGNENREYVHPDVQKERDRKEKEEERKAEKKTVDPKAMEPIADMIEKLAKAFFKSKGIDLDKPKQKAEEAVEETVPATDDSGEDYDVWRDTIREELYGDDSEQITMDDISEEEENETEDKPTEDE